MFDELLKRRDVLKFINDVCTNRAYFLKKASTFEKDLFPLSNKMALYIFYDALYKYQILIDDVSLFEGFLSQLERVYRKIDNFEDIRVGIHKLLCRMLVTKLSIDDINDCDCKKRLCSYVYDKYIINGYFIHGFASCYCDFLEENAFIPEKYESYYDSFSQIDSIFKKYIGRDIITKDFSSNKVFFTDDFVMGCYYSIYAPMFFYEFLSNELFGKSKRNNLLDIYDYEMLVSSLKKFMSNNLFADADRKFVLEVVKKQWDFLQKNNKKISLLLVKRKKIIAKETSLDKYLNDNHTIYEVIDDILSSKCSNVSSDLVLSPLDFELVTIDSYCQPVLKEQKRDYCEKDEANNVEDLDDNGSVSLLILVGALLISLGVIITILSLLKEVIK